MAYLFLLLLVSLLLLSSSSSASDTTTTSFVYAGCTQPKYTPGSSYEYNIDSLFTSLANAASFTSYANFTSASATPSSPVSGLFQCRADLPSPSCASCVRSSLSQLSSICPSATGAAIQLDGCLLRYGNDSFLGRPDTTLLYKRCGASAAGGGGSLVGMRDAALAAMQAAAAQGGTYRAAGAGEVEAVAQCVGDLDGKECGDCVSSAVAQLRESCVLAVSGDLYLGKCYARYWSSGGGGGSRSGGGNRDHAGKTVAILIGLLAGVVIIIVFLSFIRRSGDGKS